MTSLQKRILWAVAAISFVFNSCALGFGLWSDHDLEKRGISIAAILAEGGR